MNIGLTFLISNPAIQVHSEIWNPVFHNAQMHYKSLRRYDTTIFQIYLTSEPFLYVEYYLRSLSWEKYHKICSGLWSFLNASTVGYLREVFDHLNNENLLNFNIKENITCLEDSSNLFLIVWSYNEHYL